MRLPRPRRRPSRAPGVHREAAATVQFPAVPGRPVVFDWYAVSAGIALAGWALCLAGWVVLQATPIS
jgi:hypothetical protein